MHVYFVLSEEFESGGSYEPPEPPEYGCVCQIVVADKRSGAKYLAIQSDRAIRGLKPVDWPVFAIRRIGEMEGPARVLDSKAADEWWDKCPDIPTPTRKPYDPGFSQRDVAILGGDPSL